MAETRRDMLMNPGNIDRPKNQSGTRRIETTGDYTAYLFDDYDFDIASHTLHYQGAPVALEPKVASFLALLVVSSGNLVSRETLRAALWSDGSGSDDALNYLASRARAALVRCKRPALIGCRGRGYRLDIAATRGSRSVGNDPLLARRDELSQLARMLTRCARTRGSCSALITGPPGIGKTALVQGFIREKVGPSWQVAWGHCRPLLNSSLEPWLAILGELCTECPIGTEYDKHGRLDVVKRELSRIVRQAPVLLVVEDIHFADESTLGLLESIPVDVCPGALMLIATCRTPAPRERRRQLDAVARGARMFALGPLPESTSRNLLNRACGRPAERSLEQASLALAAGNPAVLVAIASLLQKNPAEFDVSELYRSPSPILNGIHYLFDALDGDERELLMIAAVAGVEFSARVVAAVATVKVSDVVQRFSRAVECEVLRPRSEWTYVFVQPTCREYLYRTLAETKRRSMHWTIGLAISRLGLAGSDAEPSLVAFHLSEGVVSEVQASEAVNVILRCAGISLRRQELDAAAAAYTLALRLSERAGQPSPERVGVALSAARALHEAGALQSAALLVRAAIDIARAQEDWVNLGRAADLLLTVDSTPTSKNP
jgi:DNA-binding winged helix-turn-helix (wHTH) protein